ncbi:Gfo/Idh/MocA family protein [Candidatus Poribacteria bacterium]
MDEIKKTRFAQLSFWFGHAYGICSAVKKNPLSELICVWDEDEERGRQAAGRVGVEFVQDLDKLLARSDIEAVGIACPTQMHIDLIEMAAKAGKHCIVEKPFTRTVEEAERAVKAAETYGVQIMPAYNLRFTPAHQKMKEIVDSEELGILYQVRRRHGHDIYHRLNHDAQAIMDDPQWPWIDAHGEGRDALYHAGSHAILWMLWMFGMPQSVSAVGSNIVRDLPVADNHADVFRYESGLLVTLHLSETETAAPLATEIYGTEGALVQIRGDHPSTRVVCATDQALMMYTRKTNEWQPIPGLSSDFQPKGIGSSSTWPFFEALAEGRETPVSVYDGRDCMMVLEAAERSARERREVTI